MMKWKVIIYNWPTMHTKIFYATQGILLYKKSSNRQSAEVICRFDSLTTANSKRQKSHNIYDHWKSYWLLVLDDMTINIDIVMFSLHDTEL